MLFTALLRGHTSQFVEHKKSPQIQDYPWVVGAWHILSFLTRAQESGIVLQPLILARKPIFTCLVKKRTMALVG